MGVRAYIPPQPLSEFVELLWFSEGTRASHIYERVLPTGTVELVINLLEEPLQVWQRHRPDNAGTFRGAVISGVHSEYFVINPASKASLIGVHFRPGGAFPFFDMPVDELHNAHVSLETIWGYDARQLREQLLAANSTAERFRLLEQALLRRISTFRPRHRAVTFAISALGNSTQDCVISAVIGQTGYSARRFIEMFKEEVGLTPKLFHRILRFQHALETIQHASEPDWANVACGSGYYDQAHFIHDFKEFSGLTPSEYFRHRKEGRNHVPLPA